jgi:hypothetical protein
MTKYGHPLGLRTEFIHEESHSLLEFVGPVYFVDPRAMNSASGIFM